VSATNGNGLLGAYRFQSRCEGCEWQGPRRSARRDAEDDGREHEDAA
jgi:hypothetical protein